MRHTTLRGPLAEPLSDSFSTASGHTFFTTFVHSIARATTILGVALRVARERHALAALDDRMLKDIGMSRSLAHLETSRPFLDVPTARLRDHV